MTCFEEIPGNLRVSAAKTCKATETAENWMDQISWPVGIS